MCDQYLPSSGTHICINEMNSINTQIDDDSEILCPGCKLKISKSRKSPPQFENTCENCHNNKVGIGLPLMIPSEHQEKEVVKWINGIEERKVKWSVIKNIVRS